MDERDGAAETARALATEHRSTALLEEDFPSIMSRCVERLEEPCGTASAPAALELSRFASQSVKVVLSGQGADEPLGGYQRHQAAAALTLLGRLPVRSGAPLRALAESLPRNERIKRAARLVGAPSPREQLLRIFEITGAGLRAELRRGAATEAAEERQRLAAGVLVDIEGRDLLEQGLYLDTHLFLPDGLLIYGDKMSMTWGLEQRVPFLDVDLMRFIERIPSRLRVRRLTRKWLYRRAIGGLVPRGALERRKHPFATPYDDWLRTSLGDAIEASYGPRSELRSLVDPTVVSRLVSEHRSGRFDHKRVLFCLLELSLWHRHYIG